MASQRNTVGHGFTLIELSLVLVIIGLIIGGVLVGKDMIKASEVRAQISQLEKFSTAVHTFRLKYGQMPGDMDGVNAASLGFVARAGTAGRGDNNGAIISNNYAAPIAPWYALYPWGQSAEALFFWEDLSQSELIEGRFNTAADAAFGFTSNRFERYFPAAKIGNGNFVSVFSGGIYSGGVLSDPHKNFFTVSIPVSITGSGNYTSSAGMSAQQAYNIDLKIDDGLPRAGTVKAFFNQGGGAPVAWSTNAATDDATTCFNTTSNTYSISNGDALNCGLSLRLQ